MVQSVRTRVPRSRCVHHPERLDADAINNAPRRSGSSRVGRLVSRAVPAALPNVLGRAFGLSRFTFRGAPRTGGRPHRAKPARSPFHRYPDELHVPQRGLVVFLHADPILFDLSPALLDGAPTWAMDVSDNRVRCRIFRTLRITRALAAKRIVGAWRFRGLSLARVCARNVVRNVAPPISRARRMVSSSRRRFRSWTNPVSRGAAALRRPLQLHFRRFRHGRVLHARNRRHRRNYLTIQQPGETVRARRTLFVWFVSDSPAICHLAGAPHSRTTDLDVPVNRSRNAGRAQRVGNALGKSNEHADEQTRFTKKASARLDLLLLALFQ